MLTLYMTWEKDGKLAFFILTSANLSKAAWGSINKDGSSCLVNTFIKLQLNYPLI